MVTNYKCPATSRTFYSWLVIDDAQQSDALVEYRFSASAYVYDPYPQPTIVFNEFTLNLSPGTFNFIYMTHFIPHYPPTLPH